MNFRPNVRYDWVDGNSNAFLLLSVMARRLNFYFLTTSHNYFLKSIHKGIFLKNAPTGAVFPLPYCRVPAVIFLVRMLALDFNNPSIAPFIYADLTLPQLMYFYEIFIWSPISLQKFYA